MTDKDFLYQGAEAQIFISKYLDYDVVVKKRISKSYRIKEIDEKLISYRTREESKLISNARKSGVSVPIIYDIDLKNGIITMQYVKGRRVKDIIEELPEDDKKDIFTKIGRDIAKLHKNDIIHGDITTSNMILSDDKIFFIDFGLGEINTEIEAKGVDLHVLMEAIESTHSKYAYCFNYVIKAYEKEYKKDATQVIKKIQDIVKRGRYR